MGISPAFSITYRDPRTGHRLTFRPANAVPEGNVTGYLDSQTDSFPIVAGIPRFCKMDNYADSFGYQWQQFATTQLDSKSKWQGHSEHRLFHETGWSRDLSGQRILEVGSGMGRFTEILACTGAEVCTFDYSTAINANFANNSHHPNVYFAQADIYCPPYEPASFDKVLCIGVLQHCPSPSQAFNTLLRFLKPGGEIVIDIYRLGWTSLLYGKYYLRPITRQLPAPLLHKFVRFHVGWVFPFTGAIRKMIGPKARRLSMLMGMADYRGVYPVDDATAKILSEMDTFDMLAPAYDRPKTLGTVKKWFKGAKLVDVDVRLGWNGVQGRGRKPELSHT